MEKFLFILNSETLTHETYRKVITSPTFSTDICGVNSFEMACHVVKEGVETGVTCINLCGDFGPEEIEKIKKVIRHDLNISYVKYSKEEEDKLNKLEKMTAYGIIVMWHDYNLEKTIMESEELTTEIITVKNLDQACKAAEILVNEGIDFIELCSAFNESDSKVISDYIKGAVPMGYAGL